METRLIFGPPGTGKTRTMVEIASGCSNPLFITFTKSAATEISNRCKFDSSTIHSFAFRSNGMNRAQVVDYRKLAEFSKLIGYEFTWQDDLPPTTGDVLLSMIQYKTAMMTGYEETINKFHDDGISFEMLQHFDESFTEWKRVLGYTDFNDMLIQLVGRDFEVKYDELFVDEAQDLSPLQWEIVKKIAAQVKITYIAGDDDQCVHSWAGADPHGMAKFMELGHSKSKILDKSHRVPHRVYDIAQGVIKNVQNRVQKNYAPSDEEGLVEYYGAIDYCTFNPGTMVLCRDKVSKKEVEKYLLSEAIPYRIVGDYSLFDGKYANMLRKGEISVDETPASVYDYLSRVDLSEKKPVLVSTIHASKGMEADHVILMNGMAERVWRNVDENEHRVWYVGVTRAKHKLDIVNYDNPFLS